MKNLLVFLVPFMVYIYADELYYYQDDQKVTLVPYHDRFTQQSNIDYYKNNNGLVVGVTDKIIIKTSAGTDIAKYLDAFNLSLLKRLDDDIYLLRTQDKSLTLGTANKLNEQEHIVYAHPDFIKRRILR